MIEKKWKPKLWLGILQWNKMEFKANSQLNKGIEISNEELAQRIIADLTTLSGDSRPAKVLTLRLKEKLTQQQVVEQLGFNLGQVRQYEQMGLRLLGIANKLSESERKKITYMLRIGPRL